nr:ECF transporter S component [Candidatus Njordarchaeota archaeon]
MESSVSTKQLSVVSLLSAVGAVVRIGFGRIAYSMPYVPLPFGFSLYGVFIKIGLTETLTFMSGFVFGPAQGFLTGALIIIVSDIFSVYGLGLWTPFVAVIIGLLGILGGVFRRIKRNPSTMFLAVSAVTVTMISELLQNVWFAWYMWTFYMPETPFLVVLVIMLVGGIPSIVTALVNNVVFFTAISPTIIRVLRKEVGVKLS